MTTPIGERLDEIVALMAPYQRRTLVQELR